MLTRRSRLAWSEVRRVPAVRVVVLKGSVPTFGVLLMLCGFLRLQEWVYGDTPAPGGVVVMFGVLLLLVGVVAVWVAFFLLVGLRRIRVRAFRCRGRVCPGCLYDLRGVPEGACPECGRAFSVESLAWSWGPTIELVRRTRAKRRGRNPKG